MANPELLPDFLRYTCPDCNTTWLEAMTPEYGACDDECGNCGRRHLSPEVIELAPLTQVAPLLLSACQTLKAAWDAGEASNDVEWEDLTVAVGLAEEALAALATVQST